MLPRGGAVLLGGKSAALSPPRPAVEWSPVRGGRLLEGFSWVVRPVLVCVSLRNWGRVWRGFRLLLRGGL